MDFYKGNIPILEPENVAHADIFFPRNQARGYVERDYALYPEPMFSPPSEMELIPESEHDARFDMQEETQSSLEHIYLSGPNGEPAFVNLDQNGFPDCWAHSTAHSVMIDRLVQGLPIVKFNGVAIATMLGQLQGGWCGLSAKFGRENGMPVLGDGVGEWALHTRNKKYDTPELRERMKLFMIAEDWCDMTRQVYDQNLTKAQVATCGFSNIVGPRDYNFWSHSVCGLRWVRIERGSWGQLILNSWKGWGRFGLAVLRGTQSICNGGLGIRRTLASIGSMPTGIVTV